MRVTPGACLRHDMRFVPVKTEDQQAALMRHRTRDFLVRQQTQLSVAPQARFQRNAIRAHLGEFGIVTAKGVHNVERLLTLADAASLPAPARQSIQLLADQFRDTHDLIEAITTGIKAKVQKDAVAKRLQTIPGIGPITASAIAAACRKNDPPDRFLTLLPDVSNFKATCDLAASC